LHSSSSESAGRFFSSKSSQTHSCPQSRWCISSKHKPAFFQHGTSSLPLSPQHFPHHFFQHSSSQSALNSGQSATTSQFRISIATLFHSIIHQQSQQHHSRQQSSQTGFQSFFSSPAHTAVGTQQSHTHSRFWGVIKEASVQIGIISTPGSKTHGSQHILLISITLHPSGSPFPPWGVKAPISAHTSYRHSAWQVQMSNVLGTLSFHRGAACTFVRP